MKYQASKLRKLAASGVVGLAFVHSLQAATVLTGVIGTEIDEDDPPPGNPIGNRNNRKVPADHGSYLPGTPDIGLTWAPRGAGGWETYNGWPNGGDGGKVYQLDGPGSGYTGGINYTIAFAPNSATIAVALTSLTLNNYGGDGDITLDWSVMGSVSGLIQSGAGVVVADGPGGTTLDLALSSQGVGGEVLTLVLTPTGGTGSYFAIDNLSFDQVAIPEPSGTVLAAAGLGALALRRRRK